MMNDVELLEEAYKRGHAFNPKYPNLANLDLGRIGKMDGSEADAKALIASRQESDINFDTLVLAFHKRLPAFDGEIGPATQLLAECPRCPIPDHPAPPGASFDLGDAELNKIARTQQEWAEASGSGSWPSSGCDPERKGIHSIRVRIDPSGAPSNVLSYKDLALKACVDAYAAIGLSVRYLWDAASPAEITKTFANLRGGVIGINYFPRGGCTRITGQLSRSYAPNDGGKLWANLECHETGHGVGLQHTRGHIMNPSIVLVWPLTWRGSPSLSALTRYFGGEPIAPKVPDVPTPNPPADPKPPISPVPGEVARYTLGGETFEVRKVSDRPLPPIRV